MDNEDSQPQVLEKLSDEERRKLLKPSVTIEEAVQILRNLYANSGDDTVEVLSELESYDDVNFKVKWNGTPYLLKIHNGVESADFVQVYDAAGGRYNKPGHMNSVIHLQTAMMDLLSTNDIPTSAPIPSKTGVPVGIQKLSVVSPKHSPQQLVIRLLTWVDGKLMSAVPHMPVETLADCGRLLGKVHSVLNMLDASSLVNVGEKPKEEMMVTTDNIREAQLWKVPESGLDLSLLDAARRYHQWDGKNTSGLRPFCKYIEDEKRRSLVVSIIDAFEHEIVESNDSAEFRVAVIQGDFNDANILLNDDLTARGVIDFGDSVQSWRVLDVSVGMAYAVLTSYGKSNHGISAAAAMLRGYHSVSPLLPVEKKHLVLLVACRLACSVTLGAYSYHQNPENQYLLFHSEPAWKALEMIWCYDGNQRTRVRAAFVRVLEQACLCTKTDNGAIDCTDLVVTDASLQSESAATSLTGAATDDGTNTDSSNTSANNDATMTNHHQQTEAQLIAIADDIKASQPLTAEKQPLVPHLLQQYCSPTGSSDTSLSSPHFVTGIQALHDMQYEGYRPIRGDGNCYYRALLYRIVELLVIQSESNTGTGAGQRLLDFIRTTSWSQVLAAGYSEFAVESFYEAFVEVLQEVVEGLNDSSSNNNGTTKSKKDWHVALNLENDVSDYCMWYLRLLTATYLKSDPGRFLPFLESNGDYFEDIAAYTAREVEPMGKECEMVSVLAAAEALQIHVVVQYLDGHAPLPTRHAFGPSDAELQVHVLYRPGHYDILYPKEEAKEEGQVKRKADSTSSTQPKSTRAVAGSGNLPLLLLLCLVFCVLPVTTSAAKKWGNGYTWQAGVDRTTGMAWSTEVSRMGSAMQTDSSGLLATSPPSIASTRQVIGNYPQWLCRGRVTLGLLRAVPIDRGAATRVQTRFFGINILTFGKPSGHHLSFRMHEASKEAIEWKYPLLGGLMTTTVTATRPPGYLVMRLQSDESPQYHPVFATGLVNYTPALVGKKAWYNPLRPLRTAFYLSTQSVIHGHIMWRFHNHVRQCCYQSK